MEKRLYEEPEIEWIPFAGDVITGSPEPEVSDITGGGGEDIPDTDQWN